MNMWDFVLKLRNKECPDDMNEMLNFWTEELCKAREIRGWFGNGVQLKEDYVRTAVIDIMISAGKKEDENEKNKDIFKKFIEKYIDTKDEAKREEDIKKLFYAAIRNKVFEMMFSRRKASGEDPDKNYEYKPKEPTMNALSIDYTPDDEKSMEQKRRELQDMDVEDVVSCYQIMELVDTEIFDKVVDFIETKDAWGRSSEFDNGKFPIYFHNPKFVDIKTCKDFDKLVWTKNVTKNLCLDDEGEYARDFILFMPWQKYPVKGGGKYTAKKYIGYIEAQYIKSRIEQKFRQLNLNDSTISEHLKGKQGVEKEFYRLLDEKKLTNKDIQAYCYQEFEDIIRENFKERMPDIIDLENLEKNSEFSD